MREIPTETVSFSLITTRPDRYLFFLGTRTIDIIFENKRDLFLSGRATCPCRYFVNNPNQGSGARFKAAALFPSAETLVLQNNRVLLHCTVYFVNS